MGTRLGGGKQDSALPARVPALQTTSSVLRVCALYIGLVLGFLSLLQVDAVEHSLLAPVRIGVAWAVSKVLNFLGIMAVNQGSNIWGPGLAVTILTECVGIEAMILVLPAVLAFPASWRAKGVGILLSLGVLGVVNFIRIVSLCYLATYHSAWVELGHLYVWPTVVIVAALSTLLLWVNRFGPAVQR